ncbi:hypothetical protein ZHAS_00016769 [Anopheles sinensis]|uniref:Uncharacterized protein n=1 Tax=Anopheles sinensis TaxID=74873 RepID=A0A084WEW8_ANOSI|nr:hypothetical protein ZHAS_00016769 [Anopheles sinensis]
MGSLNSKISPSTILPAVEQGEGPFIDPRSPTLNINRSPIHQEGIVTRATITKGKNLATELTETDPSPHLQTPINLLPKRFQSIIDPRSPSTFTRTPLVVDPASPATDSNDSSLTTVVSSLAYEDHSIIQEEDNMDASFKDCESQLPEICNLQIEYDDSAPIIEPTGEACEDTAFEDALVVPFAGNDPRSPSIAIARTPMILVHDDAEGDEANNKQQVESVLGHTKEATESQHCTPQQGIQDSAVRGEQTPKKDNVTPKAGSRTPLGCVTNTGGISHIRKIALMGQMKKTIGNDEQKLLARTGNSGSAESNVSSKNINRSRIPKLRLS